MKFSFQALGTTWWIEIFEELSEQTGAEIKDFCTGFATTFEANYSRFKTDSLISLLNRDRVIEQPSAELVQLLTYGKQLYLRLDTHFNILTGHILEARGYDADYSFATTSNSIPAGNPVTDLQITPDKIILLGESRVDLGGFGKGYLIDLLASELKQAYDIEQFVINGGGDMYATNNNGKPIAIHLEHPTKPGTMITHTALLNQGFAASSPHKRVWENTAGKHSHIITNQLTADATFIKATSSADADAIATAALQMTQPQLEQLTKSEKIAVALFNVQADQLVSTKDFHST